MTSSSAPRGVLVLSGPPCSGKSTVGRLLRSASTERRVHLEVDALFSLLLPGSDRNRHDRLLAYDAAHAVARSLLARGEGVVLECTYARHEQRSSLIEALGGAALWVVEVSVTPDEAVRRFRTRHQATDLDDEGVRERAAAFPYSSLALRLDSAAAAPEELARQVASWLHAGPRPVEPRAWAEAGRGWERADG